MSAHFSVERLYPSTPFVYRYPFGNPVVVARSVFYLKKIRSPSAAIKSKLKSTFLTLSVPKSPLKLCCPGVSRSFPKIYIGL